MEVLGIMLSHEGRVVTNVEHRVGTAGGQCGSRVVDVASCPKRYGAIATMGVFISPGRCSDSAAGQEWESEVTL
eukprot:6898479-Pyramimonas_sp.AAC.1